MINEKKWPIVKNKFVKVNYLLTAKKIYGFSLKRTKF